MRMRRVRINLDALEHAAAAPGEYDGVSVAERVADLGLLAARELEIAQFTAAREQGVRIRVGAERHIAVQRGDDTAAHRGVEIEPYTVPGDRGERTEQQQA